MIYKTNPETIFPYLKDASNFAEGSAEKVVIPESLDDLLLFLKTNDTPITIAGARTGMTASCIPRSGYIISLESFKELSISTKGYVDVGPAVSIKELNEYLNTTQFFYPPNPTEQLASIGGTLSTNASGSRSYKYGVTRDYVLEADIVLADGGLLTLKRGLSIKNPLKLSNGKLIKFPNITYQSPICKNAAGYYIQPGMDWLDLFIGSDGTLGIFTRIRLRIILRPEVFFSGVLFFKKEEESWHLVDSIKNKNCNLINPCSLEYFDSRSLNKLRKKFNNIPFNSKAAIFFENDVISQNDFTNTQKEWFQYLSEKKVSLNDSWIAQTDNDLRKFHNFRHAIPALINEENVQSKRTKIGTDMAVSDEHFFDMMLFYKKELEKSEIDYVVFGHLGDNHLHINLLPDKNQLKQAETLNQNLVDQILKWNGTISAEHGIGKLKKDYFLMMVGDAGLSELKTIKQILDPRLVLGLGNIF